MEHWRAAGLARPWTDTLAVSGSDRDRAAGPMRWAAPAGLQSLVADLADGLPVELGRTVRSVGPGPLVDGEPADVVVLAMPDPQARRAGRPGVPGRRGARRTAVVAGDRRRRGLAGPRVGRSCRPRSSTTTRCSPRRRRRRPARRRAAVLVAHTTAGVARGARRGPRAAPFPPCWPRCASCSAVTSPPAVDLRPRLWRRASPGRAATRPFHLGDDGIAVAGDGWGSPRVETAWRSGTLLGHALVERLRAG